jgi:hypothetical protein
MLDSLIKLKVSVHIAAKTLVTLTFVRFEHAWINENTCAQLLEYLDKIADQLNKCDVVFKCFITIGV